MAQILQIDTSQREALKEVRQGLSRLATLDRYLGRQSGGVIKGNCTFIYTEDGGKRRSWSFPCTSDVFENVLLNEANEIATKVREKSQRHMIGLEEPEAALCRKYESVKRKGAVRKE